MDDNKKYVVIVDDKVICHAVGMKNANFIAQSIYQMRGFYSDNFSEVSVTIKDDDNG